MKTAYIYNVSTNEVVAKYEATTNEQCEELANTDGYMGVDEYGLTYSPEQLLPDDDAKQHDRKYQKQD